MASSIKPFSRQTEAIYKILLDDQPLDAKEISERLNVLPHAVYRSIKPLLSVGLVKKLNEYPVKFGITTSQDALDAYFLTTRENFLQTFFPNGVNEDKKGKVALNISFIKDRQELLERSNQDMGKVRSGVNLIVSGLEVPAETILEYKRAVDRGVKIRTLVQRLDETNAEMLGNWRKIGIDVRFFPLLEARILIFDNELVYITSYNPNNQNEGIGMRFDYPPVARIMNEIFEQRWKNSEEI